MYLAQVTRNDIFRSANHLARAMSKPSNVYVGAAKHVLRYLDGTINHDITYMSGGVTLARGWFSNDNWGETSHGKGCTFWAMLFCLSDWLSS